ncbi:MAG TPA: universal stress protein [Candidatus Baltobacteraceae bacterium]|nr:universal stress protein [Candidatus Baltobacteraceae bacterium]
MKDRILVPVDGSEYALHALDTAADLGRATGATIIVCHVVDIAKASMMSFGEAQLVAACFDALHQEGEGIVRDAVQHLRDRLGNDASIESRIAQGNTVEEITRIAAEMHATWIVMGSHGRTGLVRMLMGSIAEGVLRHSPVPIVIVPVRHVHRRTATEHAVVAAES